MDTIACHVTYNDRVQDVDFRFTVVQLARQRAGVVGYVRNLHNGDVDVWAEGPADEVDAFIRDIATGPHAPHIRHAEVVRAEPVGSFKDFLIQW